LEPVGTTSLQHLGTYLSLGYGLALVHMVGQGQGWKGQWSMTHWGFVGHQVLDQQDWLNP